MFQEGAPGVIGSFFTVVGVAEIINFWPWIWQFRKCFKINACTWPNFTGFLARLITATMMGAPVSTKISLQHIGYKSVGAYRKFTGVNAWTPGMSSGGPSNMKSTDVKHLQSDIEWTDVTWNPSTGYSKVSSGCK